MTNCVAVPEYVEHAEFIEAATALGFNMIPKIKKISQEPDFILKVLFDDGHSVLYDVKDDINTLPTFKDLENICGLWQHVQVDESRTCVFWNDFIDLPSDTIYEYGKTIGNA